MRIFIKNGTIYTGETVLSQAGVLLNGDKIERVEKMNDIERSTEKFEKTVDLWIDAQGRNVIPGFIDIQVNGGGDALFNDLPTVEGLETISQAHKKLGTTSMLPTFLSDTKEKLSQAMAAAREFMQKQTDSDYSVLGLHLEGPYLSPLKAGIHEKQCFRNCSWEELTNICDAVKMLTVAPEAIQPEQIRYLTEKGVLVFAGHSNATFEQSLRFFETGGKGVTHLFNAMSQLTQREPGLVGAALLNKDVWAGIIVDGQHVHFANVQLAKQLKPKRLLLVTDAQPPVGGSGQPFSIGQTVISPTQGACRAIDGTLAGATISMAEAVGNCIQKCNIPFTEAVKMASTYPAELLGYGQTLGKIKAGYHANLLITDHQAHVEKVICNGKLVNGASRVNG